jgi:hypothetical protein
MKPELITACQMFLVPSTIMFAALGVAGSEGKPLWPHCAVAGILGTAVCSPFFRSASRPPYRAPL